MVWNMAPIKAADERLASKLRQELRREIQFTGISNDELGGCERKRQRESVQTLTYTQLPFCVRADFITNKIVFAQRAERTESHKRSGKATLANSEVGGSSCHTTCELHQGIPYLCNRKIVRKHSKTDDTRDSRHWKEKILCTDTTSPDYTLEPWDIRKESTM
jgi:hypothetical protein